MLLGGLVMALTKYRLGDFIELYSEKCGMPNLSVWDISGVNSKKEFFEPSKQVGADTSAYKIVPPNFFACNLMHVGRDKVLPIALNHSGKNKIVSPAYTIFKIKEETPLLKEYFFMMLKSDERDRYFWFHTDSSVRDGMSWDDFCDLIVELPTLEVQQKYVDIYESMSKNQACYEKSLGDIIFSLDAVVDNYKHKSIRKKVGDIVREVDEKNEDGLITNVQGINITKQFMPSVADTTNVNLEKYKVVRRGQFAYSGMQTGRDECIRIALFDKDDPIIISPAYTVLEIKDDLVLPEYFMMWFTRKESDRLGWFLSDSSIRANLDLDRFYEIEIPVPDVKVQQAIVDIYKAYTERRRTNELLKTQIDTVCPILIKGSVEESR